MASPNEFLRHTLAAMAYRAEKALRNAPPDFADFKIGDTTRTPLEILSHMGDLFDWALTMAKGKAEWKTAVPRKWDDEIDRFFASVKDFDDYLASHKLSQGVPEKLFQGPIADAIQHAGQINLLRRLANAPIRGESYARAKIEAGRVGKDQSSERFEFD